jgi:Bacterial Ig domain
MKRALLAAVAGLVLAVPSAQAAPPPPVVTAPSDGALLPATPIAFSGTTAAGTAIVISEAGAAVGGADSPDGTWSAAVPATDGTHIYQVIAKDADGNPSDPVTRTVTVDTTAPGAPEITAPAQDSVQRSTTVTLSGSAEPSANIAVAEGPDARGATKAGADGAWTVTITDAPEGVHEYTATATDESGHTSPASPARRVHVDLTPPPAPVVSGDETGFTLVSPEPDAALACSLDGGAFAACASGVRYAGLSDGEHVLVVRATDAAGNASTTEHRFTVSHPTAATPTPVPTAIPTPTPIATPSYRKTVVLRPQAGRTLIRRPGETAFTEIRTRTAVAVGTVVDVKQGTVIVIAATATTTETARFSGGVFTASGTDLRLSEKLRCGRARRLTGDGAGAFRIRGRYASATGRGAKWTVEDTCKQTRIRVARGVVAVRDTRRPKAVLIRSGRSYTARPKR